MGFSRRGAAAFVLIATASVPSLAAGPHRSTTRLAADTLTALPAAGVKRAVRTYVTTRAQAAPGPAWAKFATGAGGTWTAAWDVATGVPRQIYGSGMPVPGAVASAIAAEGAARAMLAAHLDLLAPGAAVSDFELVSNVLDGDLRAVGFVQKQGGRVVVGGQIGFEFKHDRLFVIHSTALPDVTVVEPRARLAQLQPRAAASLRALLALPNAPVTPPAADVIVPFVTDGAVMGYRVAAPLVIDGGADGKYLAYADPESGEPIALQQQNLYEDGTVLYLGIDRYPANGRIERPAPRAYVTLGGQAQTTTQTGGVTWSSGDPQPVLPAVTGDLATLVNMGSGGPFAPPTLSLAPDDQVVWDPSADPEVDAQAQLYLDLNIVKEFVRTFAPDMPSLDGQIKINANIQQACNAFFDGATLNFFHATSECQNTGLVQDVVFHEFGHDLHESEIIPGVGAFDGAMSEGAADTLAVNITEDHGMGRGFFYTNDPLRDLDPPHSEAVWPNDIGEIHTTGLIFGGSFWDLRTSLIATYGHDPGIALLLKLYLGALRRSVDIPSSLIEVLATDDDDGDLTNGTPNECLIRNAFGRHGLRTISGTVEAPGSLDIAAAAITVSVRLDGLTTRCTGDAMVDSGITWKPGPTTNQPAAGMVVDTPTTGIPQFYAQLPLAPSDSVLFQRVTQFTDTTRFTLPDNFADPWYQQYQGETIKLYCNDFESGDPFAAGWTTGTKNGSASPWVWGVPTGGATDPRAAYSGTHIVAQALDGDYAASSTSWVKLPPIDVGHYSDVRLQYRRWLAVEDSYFDQAHVTANDNQAWINATDGMGSSSDLQHIDREWRFHDVPLSKYFTGPMLTVGFDLTADEGLEFGGWQLDDVCVVANPASICGDGAVSPTEQCDNGSANADVPNTCRTSCRMPACGDTIVDDGEDCDQGPNGDDTCTADCKHIEVAVSGGCAAGSGSSSGGWVFLLAPLGLLVARRRRPLS